MDDERVEEIRERADRMVEEGEPRDRFDTEASASVESNVGIMNFQVNDSDANVAVRGPMKFREDGDTYMKVSFFLENDWPDDDDREPHEADAVGGFTLSLEQAENLANWLLLRVGKDAEVLFPDLDEFGKDES